jgi:acyl carrier protein
MLSKGLKSFFALSKEFSRRGAQVTPRFFFAADAKAGTEVSTKVDKQQKKKDISVYIDGQIVNRNQLVLKKDEDIEAYVLKTLRNYFRTTNKLGLTPESRLSDHGLDSLDSIELAMQLEEDLGYTISAETLPVLNKVKHFINYIKHVEQFKHETRRDPLP